MSDDTEKFSEYYKKKKVTGTYDLQREGTEYRRKKRELELKYFLELIDKKEGEKVLELGCSSGFLTEHLGEVTAIDTSKDMLTIAYNRNSQAKCIYGDMFKIPFNKNYFDKVVTMRVWNHLNKEDLIRAIKESKRVLKEGGHLIFDFEDKSFLRRFAGFFYQLIFKTTGYKIYQYSRKEIEYLLETEGFTIERMEFLKHRVGRQIILRSKYN